MQLVDIAVTIGDRHPITTYVTLADNVNVDDNT